MRAVRNFIAVGVVFAAVMGTSGESSGQVLGTFRWQLSPFCNVLTLTVLQAGSELLLSGIDDNCGLATPSGAHGKALVLPSGSVGMDVTVIGAAGAIHNAIQVSATTGSGTWSDSLGNAGAFVFGPASTSGSPRPLMRAAGTWGEPINPAASRFIVLAGFNGQAVLDRETGLVWERSPETDPHPWLLAQSGCVARTVGGRRGWRLPTIQELSSLVDPTVAAPALPIGHPFSNVKSAGQIFYWSATSYAPDPTNAWLVTFDIGGLGIAGKTFSHNVWCVRGGQGVDPQ
jgi:hypothetical protein